ncbi:MAG: S8 family peptidase [Candidatus Omnitrophica bacterium]|nr:S8 family peptidase [Candidatus Omnitrophota bacterium]
MKKIKDLIFFSFWIFILLFLGNLNGSDTWIPVKGKDLFVPGEFIVQYRPEKTSLTEIKSFFISKNLEIKKVGVYAPIVVCKGRNLEEVKSKLLPNPNIVSIEPNYIAYLPEPCYSGELKQNENIEILTQTSDSLLSYQWGYYKIWAHLTKDVPSNAPTIAILDTGVWYDHPDLKGKVIKGPDFVNGDNDPLDDHGHGTHVAGIAAAISNNGIGIAGISPKSKIYAVKVITAQGWATYADIVDGIYHVSNRSDVKIINMSFGGPHSQILENMINYAFSKGKILVAAAGNENTSIPSYPAGYDCVIAVAASDEYDWKADFSNYGNWVDIAAPGVDIISTVPGYIYGIDYGIWDGTSMAAPFVSGACARILAQYPNLTNIQVEQILKNNGDNLPPLRWPEGTNFKRLNLYKSLSGTSSPDASVSAYITDAITGLPLVGAKFSAYLGNTLVAYDYVPVEGYSFFVIEDLVETGNYIFKITKPKYANFQTPPKNLSYGSNYLGIIPVPPSTGGWQLVISWDMTEELPDFDLYLWLPSSQPYIVGPEFPGSTRFFPWARYNRDSALDYIPVESISVKKTLQGTYTIAVYNTEGGNNFKISNMRAFIYYNNSLKYIIEAQNGFGNGTEDWWVIGSFSGSTFIPFNYFTNEWPGPYNLKHKFSIQKKEKIIK